MNNDDELSNLENDVDYSDNEEEDDEENQKQLVNNYIIDEDDEDKDDDMIDEAYEEYLQKVADTINHEIFGPREEVDEVYQLEPGYWIARMLAGN
jgi:type I restriction-modification system DNA methylase subunit